MKRIMIISSARTRSTYLADICMNYNAPEQDNQYWLRPYWSEPLNQSLGYSTDNLKYAYHYYTSYDNVVVKTHADQIMTHPDQVYVRKIFNLRWYKIKLLRRNIVEQALSYARADIINTWTTVTNTEVEIPIETFELYMTRVYRAVNMTLNVLSDITPHKIIFSEDLTTPLEDWVSLGLYDDVDVTNLEQHYNKKIKQQLPKSQTIVNYDELIAHSKNIPVQKIDGVTISSKHFITDVDYNRYIIKWGY